MSDVWVYDLETFPNIFTATFIHTVTADLKVFEISERINECAPMLEWLWGQRMALAWHCGYNNVNFDYPILHLAMQAQGIGVDAAALYAKAQSIINGQNYFGSAVKPWEVLIPQIDLFKIHHFDNKSKSTGLKALQFNMRSESIEELPFAPGTWLTSTQMDVLKLQYNFHDVTETLKFYFESLPLIAFRDTLSAKYGRDFTNHNDTKIGKDYFVMRLEEVAPGSCFDANRQPRQTQRASVPIGPIIFPYVQFQHPELQRIRDWYATQQLSEYEKPSASALVNGFTFDFGVGGVHGSVTRRALVADESHCIFDLDVSGYYPALAIANRLRPEHLGDLFCEVYQEIVSQRAQHAKGTPENAMLKLAGNGVYGDSGNPYSPFYDTQYMLSVTINGQLLLAMLAEQIMLIPTVELIQINTDGMTIRAQRSMLPHLRAVGDWWQRMTLLKLEETFYTKMFIRDVNTYLAVTEGDKPKVKRKGACSWIRGYNLGDGELAWHQDHSALVVQMAAEAAMLRGTDPYTFIQAHDNLFDFMIRAKAPRSSRLELADGTRLPNVSRYYISNDGQPLYKIMPPAEGCKVGDFKRANNLTDQYFNQIEASIGGSQVWDERIHTKNRSRYDEKRIGLDVGYLVTPCNHMRDARWDNLNRSYYVRKCEELLYSVGLDEHISF